MTPVSSEHQRAQDAFVHWVSLQGAALRGAESLIERVEVTHDAVGLLDTELQGRRVVWRSAPAGARARLTVPTLALEAIDPWAVEPASLRLRSDHVAICDRCAGERKARCGACAGSGKTLCGACRGQRKMYGYAANGSRRLLNCTACRGKGETDCAACRRGIVACETCAGEGRLQRWMEVESWSRSDSRIHPEAIARSFAWQETATVSHDAELVADIDRPHRLSPGDLEEVPAEWLDALALPVGNGERVARQRLRIARVPTHTVHYRLGNDDDSIAFRGLRLLGPSSYAGTALGRRATRLRFLLFLLLGIGIVVTLVSLVRGFYFWSVPTFASLLACAVALVAIQLAAADWTAARLRTRRWLSVAISSLVLSLLFALAALPRIGHAQTRIASGALEAAESELKALGSKAPAPVWADLRLAAIRKERNINEARKTLALIPAELPQRAEETDAVDQLILHSARSDADKQRWLAATKALGSLSQGAQLRAESRALATSVYPPLVRQRLADSNWSGAADALLAARHLGVARTELEPLTATIRDAALDLVAAANRADDNGKRMRLRLAAEETFMAWERATDQWGTPPLIALRAAMARDLAAAERQERRRDTP